ncbi:MAG: PAS domain S-box protein [Gammaproteobacteria bacterium]|nr:PAS domain S-box protein [Gammaproteobacteria bacterium]
MVNHNRKIPTDSLSLTLLLLMLVLPFASIIYLLSSELEARSHLISQQKIGIDYIESMRVLLDHIQQHRGMAYAYLSGKEGFRDSLPELAQHINADIQQIQDRFPTIQMMPGVKENQKVWLRDWHVLLQQYPRMSPAGTFAAHTVIIEKYLSSMHEGIDLFRLTADKRRDTYYLAESIIVLPRLIESIAQIRGMGTGIVTHSELAETDTKPITILQESIKIEMDKLQRNMDVLFLVNPELRSNLLPQLQDVNEGIRYFLLLVQKQTGDTPQLRMSSENYFAAGTKTLGVLYRLFDATEDELDGMFKSQSKELQKKKSLLWLISLLVLVVFVVILILFLRNQRARRMMQVDLRQSVVALTQSKQKINAIIENAADGIITINAQGVVESFSRTAECMFGYYAREVIGRNVSMLMLAPDTDKQDIDQENYWGTLKGEIINKGPREITALRSDGNEFPIELSVSELPMEHEGVHFIGIVRDISQRRKSEEALRLSEERFSLVTRGTQDGIWDWDLTRDQIYFSSRWKNMLGYAEYEVENNFIALQSLIHPDDLGYALDVWADCMAGDNSSFSIEYRVRSKTGEYLWMHCRGLALLDEDGFPVRIAGSHTDVTESKRAFVELERINHELDQFAYVTSHDLKAPLRAIANLSQWIEEDLTDVMTDSTRKQMDLLRGRVARMEGLINGILQYSRAGRVDMEMEMVDVSGLLKDILQGLDCKDLSIDISPGMPLVRTARVPLFQVFSNLISNAIKYHHKDNGHIHISVRERTLEGKLITSKDNMDSQNNSDFNVLYYEFSVADDGPGIAAEYHDRIFNMFQTLQARDSVESTGVGLTLVKKIVNELGGEVEIESEEGKGAVFRFTLPVKGKVVSVETSEEQVA